MVNYMQLCDVLYSIFQKAKPKTTKAAQRKTTLPIGKLYSYTNYSSFGWDAATQLHKMLDSNSCFWHTLLCFYVYKVTAAKLTTLYPLPHLHSNICRFLRILATNSNSHFALDSHIGQGDLTPSP